MIALGLNAIFDGAPTDPEILRRIRDELGPRVFLVRADLLPCDPRSAGLIASEVVALHLQPFCTIRQASQVEFLPEGSLVEHFNEGDIEANGWDWAGDVDEMFRIIEACVRRGLKCYVGGAISNPHKRGRKFLARLPWGDIPSTVGVSIHRYVDDGDPRNPQEGCSSRVDEVARVRGIVDPSGVRRPMAVSEFGYSRTEFSDEDAASHTLFEVDFWSEHGADALIAYQIADGPNRAARDDGYGALRYDDTRPVREWQWAPWSQAFAHSLTDKESR